MFNSYLFLLLLQVKILRDRLARQQSGGAKSTKIANKTLKEPLVGGNRVVDQHDNRMTISGGDDEGEGEAEREEHEVNSSSKKRSFSFITKSSKNNDTEVDVNNEKGGNEDDVEAVEKKRRKMEMKKVDAEKKRKQINKKRREQEEKRKLIKKAVSVAQINKRGGEIGGREGGKVKAIASGGVKKGVGKDSKEGAKFTKDTLKKEKGDSLFSKGKKKDGNKTKHATITTVKGSSPGGKSGKASSPKLTTTTTSDEGGAGQGQGGSWGGFKRHRMKSKGGKRG